MPPPRVCTSLRDKTHEFSEEDFSTLVQDLHELPIWVEHDGTKVVGQVTAARKTETGHVEITAEIESDSAAGERAIEDIRTSKKLGLSLGHSYSLEPCAELSGRDLEELRIAIKSGTWGNLRADDSKHCVTKRAHEVSLCSEPAREDCYLIDYVAASKKKLQEAENGIYTATLQKMTSGQTLKFVGQVNCSNCSKMEGNTQTPAPVIEAPVAAGSDQPAAAAATAAATEAIPDSESKLDNAKELAEVAQKTDGDSAAATAEATAQKSVSGTAARARLRNADGTFAANPDPEQKDYSKFEALMTGAKDKIEEQAKQMKDQQSALAEAEKRTKEAIMKLEAYEKQAAKEAAEAAQKLAKEQEKTRLMIQKKEDDAFKQLEKLLNPNQSDIKASKSDLINLAVKEMQNNKTNDAQMKRTHADMANFSVPANALGTVNASAVQFEGAAPKRVAMEAAHMHEFRKNNPNALLSEINREFKTAQRAVNAVGVVNANKEQWGISRTEDHYQDKEDLSAKHLYPAFFNMMSEMNNGRLPQGNDATDYINRIQKPDPNMRMRY